MDADKLSRFNAQMVVLGYKPARPDGWGAPEGWEQSDGAYWMNIASQYDFDLTTGEVIELLEKVEFNRD